MPYKINNEYLANLIFLVRIVSYGSSYLTSSIFGPRSSRLGHKSEGILSVRTVKTSLVRGIYHFFVKSWKLHEIGDLYGKHSWAIEGKKIQPGILHQQGFYPMISLFGGSWTLFSVSSFHFKTKRDYFLCYERNQDLKNCKFAQVQ